MENDDMGSNRSPGFYREVIPKKTYPSPIKGKCWCCFNDLPPGKRKWCDWECQNQYWQDTHIKEYITRAQIRIEVIKRDNWTCKGCHIKFSEDQLEVHHIVPIWKGGEEFNKENLITLCIKCHNKTKKRNNVKPPQSNDESGIASFFKGAKQLTIDEQPLNQY